MTVQILLILAAFIVRELKVFYTKRKGGEGFKGGVTAGPGRDTESRIREHPFYWSAFILVGN